MAEIALALAMVFSIMVLTMVSMGGGGAAGAKPDLEAGMAVRPSAAPGGGEAATTDTVLIHYAGRRLEAGRSGGLPGRGTADPGGRAKPGLRRCSKRLNQSSYDEPDFRPVTKPKTPLAGTSTASTIQPDAILRSATNRRSHSRPSWPKLSERLSTKSGQDQIKVKPGCFNSFFNGSIHHRATFSAGALFERRRIPYENTTGHTQDLVRKSRVSNSDQPSADALAAQLSSKWLAASAAPAATSRSRPCLLAQVIHDRDSAGVNGDDNLDTLPLSPAIPDLDVCWSIGREQTQTEVKLWSSHASI